MLCHYKALYKSPVYFTLLSYFTYFRSLKLRGSFIDARKLKASEINSEHIVVTSYIRHTETVEISVYLLFTARRYASALYAVVVCPSVCPSVCLSQVGTVPKRLNAGSRKQYRTIAQGLYRFLEPKF